MQLGETLKLSSITGPFFIEVFSGSGRLAAAIRINGHTAFEFDINKKGGEKNILDKKTLHELLALIKHPNCQ